jgi:hypothetical protein
MNNASVQIKENKLMIKSESWFERELVEKRVILEKFWHERIIKLNQKSVDEFRNNIIGTPFPKHVIWEEKINKLFVDAISHKIDFDTFFDALKYMPYTLIRGMGFFEKLIELNSEEVKEIKPEIKSTDLVYLERYMKEKNISASVTLGLADETLITPDFTGNKSSAFAMHSIGKVFTGMLVLIMVKKGIISEHDLNLIPVKLDTSDTKALPFVVRERLKKVSLHQLMTHKSGLGDYLDGYFMAISEGKIPKMRRAEDFLQFAENKVSPIGEDKYSNLGILLVGLAIKHAYEKKHGPCEYNDILQKYIINEVGMPSFTPWKPENAKYNLADSQAPHIAGSPAGGYWVTSEDLAKFGQWIYRQSKINPEFESLMKKYGQEFYYPKNRIVAHAGGIQSSTAWLSVSLETGALVAVLSDQPHMAFELKNTIERNIFSKN